MVLARGFTLLELVSVGALLCVLLLSGAYVFRTDLSELRGRQINRQMGERLYALRHTATYQGVGTSLSSLDFYSAVGLQWSKQPLLGFAASGYPSKAGTLTLQSGHLSYSWIVMPASGAIRHEQAGL